MDTKKELVRILKEEYSKGTLIPKKHNPNYITDITKATKYKIRSVISYDLMANLTSFLDGGLFDAEEYTDNKNKNICWIIKPYSTSGFSVPSSGLTASTLSWIPPRLRSLDLIKVVFGVKKGYHIFGESQKNLSKQIKKRRMRFVKKLT